MPRRAARLLALAAALVSCDADTLRPRDTSHGGACTFSDECTSPLLCSAARCRVQCRTDRDCTNGWRCLSAGVVDRFVCYAPDEYETGCVWSSHCLGGRVCTPERLCRAQCRTDYDCRILRRDLTCNLAAGVCMGHPFLDDAGVLMDVLRNDPGPNVDPVTASRPIVDAGPRSDSGTVVDVGAPTDRGAVDVGVTDVGVTDVGNPRECALLTGACRPGDAGCEVTSISSHNGTSCAVISDGSLRCWGANGSGQLGTGDTRSCLWPGLVASLATGVTGVAVGQGFACAQRPGMGTWCWGNNGRGQLGTGESTPSRLLPIRNVAMEGHASAGQGHACVVSATAAQCWGENDYRQLGALFGTRSEYFAPVGVSVAGAPSLALGRSHSCVAFSAGAVGCWGSNASGQVGQAAATTMVNEPTAVMGIDSVRQVVAGTDHTCARRGDGQVLCWGDNASGQLGRGTAATPASDPTPGPVLLITDARELAAAPDGACALRTDGAVWCWGGSRHLGDGSAAARATPARVPGLAGVTALWGAGPICARLAGADVRCWGSNPGDGSAASTTPVAVAW